MTPVLRFLLEVTAYSAVIYFAILLIRKVFRRRLSPAAVCALWGLLILRFLMPVTVDSGFHFVVIPQTQEQAAQPRGIDHPAPAEDAQNQKAGNLPASEPLDAVRDAAAAPGSDEAGDESRVPVGAPIIGWQGALVLLWAAGMLASLAYRTALRRRLGRCIRKSSEAVSQDVIDLVEDCSKEMGIGKRIPVSVQKRLNTPALSASLKPRLLLPESMVNGTDRRRLEFGVRHELAHYRRKDHLTSLLLIFLRCVYWFNPVVWLAFRQMETDMECACDAVVTNGLAKRETLRYIETMIDLGSGDGMRYLLGMGAGKERKEMEKRVRSAYEKRMTSRGARCAVLLLAGVLAVACFTTACQPVLATTSPVSIAGSNAPSNTPVNSPSDTPSSTAESAEPTGTPDQSPVSTSASTPSDTPAGTSDSTPAASAQAASSLEEAVSAAVLGRNGFDPYGEKMTEGHMILSTAKDQDGNTVVYAIASYACFGFMNNVFTISSGCGAIPAVIKFIKNTDGYDLLSYTEPEDGEHNQESKKELFPKELWPKVLKADQYYADLRKQQERQAASYLKSIGRKAEVNGSPVEMELLHISAEASNALIEKKELNSYPYWIGSKEAIENEVRVIYETDEEGLSGYTVVTYTKKNEDGDVLQQFKYKITGTKVELMQ